MLKLPTEGRILLTGPKGSMGSLFLNALGKADLERIVAIDVSRPKKLPKGITFYKVDFTQPGADARIADIIESEKIDTVLHMAVLLSPRHPQAYAHEVEVIGTLYVLNACGQQHVRKLIVMSSTLVYGARATNPNYLSEHHALYGGTTNRFIRDKVELEMEVRKFRARHPRTIVTVLRPALVIGPKSRNFVTKLFGQPIIPTILGYDPLIQFLHEKDLLRAIRLALIKDVPGEFNVVGRGVLPLSYAIKLAGKVNVPLVHSLAWPVLAALWHSDLLEIPPHLLDYLRYLWVADGRRAEREFGFIARYTTKEALESFSGQERLRRVPLVPRSETREARA